jgi:allantoinase
LAELVIRNARILLPAGITTGGISIQDGKIAKISSSKLPKGEMEIDAGRKLIMPGVIDAHAHLYDPNYTHRDDFLTSTTAAAAGGVTTAILMPLDSPILTPEDVRKTIAVGEKNSLIDFSVHAGNMTSEAIEKIQSISALGVKSFKAFTCSPYMLNEQMMERFMLEVKKIGGIAFVHAEDEETLKKSKNGLLKKNRKDPLAHAESRPSEAEKKAIKNVIKLAKNTACNLHIAHVSSRQGVNLVKRAKETNIRVTAETCPHFLIFTKEDMKRLGPYLKINPSLKSEEDLEALWSGLSSGAIDIVATDHAPGTKKEKEIGWKDIWAAQTGIPGIETLLPLMLNEGVAKRRLTLMRMAELLCSKPAKIFGLYPKKGIIGEGSDADLVMIDLRKKMTIKSEKLHYKVGWTPYEGMKVKGAPVMTISKGVVIAEDGEVLGKPGHGKFLRMSPSRPA